MGRRILVKCFMIFFMVVSLILWQLSMMCRGFTSMILGKDLRMILPSACSRATGLRASWRILRSIKHNRDVPRFADDSCIMQDADGGIEGTLLHFAIKMGNIQESRDLLERRPDLLGMYADGLSPLHYAVVSDKSAARYELCQLLLEKGADVNCQSGQADDPGSTPFHWALIFADLKIVKLLMHHGDDIAPVCETGMPVYCFAFKNPNVDVLEFVLSQGIDVNSRENNYWLGLHTLVQLPEPQLEQCKILLRHGAMVNRMTESGATPLALAVGNCGNCGIFCERVEIVRALLEYGADVSAKVEGLTILEIAVKADSCRSLVCFLMSCIAELASRGFKVNAVDRWIMENDESYKKGYQFWVELEGMARTVGEKVPGLFRLIQGFNDACEGRTSE